MDNYKQSSGEKTAKRWLGAYGRFQAILLLLFGLFIGVLLIIIGYKESKDVHQESVDATVKTLENPCETQATQQYYCDVNVEYNIDGKQYTKRMQIQSSLNLKQGQKVTLYYNKANPDDIVYLSLNPKTSPLLIGIGVFIIIFVVVYNITVWKSSTFAAVSGGASLAGTLLGGGRVGPRIF
jgi:hypothetical protein